MRHLLFSLIAISFVFVSCAKDRGVEPVRPNSLVNQRAKSDFTGTGELRDVYFGKWTIVKNSRDNGFAFVGFESDMVAGFFEFNEFNMQFKSVQGAYKGRESASDIAPVLYQWPVTHHQAMLQTTDGKTTNKEIDDDRLPWYQKKNVKIDFSKFDFIQQLDFGPAGFSCWATAGVSQVEDSVTFEPGYISFVLEVVYQRNCPEAANVLNGHNTFTVQYRYSFRRMEKSNYDPMIYESENDPRRMKFGYFTSVKEEINPIDGRIKNLFLVNRWDPNKEHDFFFTKQFPAQYKELFYDIFDKTNQVFKDAKLKVRFNLRENSWHKDPKLNGKVVREFGDLRYSFVNLIEEIDQSAPLGYGPSNANPFTGEIISANLNVWSGFLRYYLVLLKTNLVRDPQWLQNPEGVWEQDMQGSKWYTSDLYEKMTDLLEQSPEEWSTGWEDRPDLRSFFAHMADKTRFIHPGANWYTYSDSLMPTTAIIEKPDSESQLGVKSNWVEVSPTGEVSTAFDIGDQIDMILNPGIKNQTTFISPKILAYSPLEKNPIMQKLATMPKAGTQWLPMEAMEEFSKSVDMYDKLKKQEISDNIRGHCVMDMQSNMAGIQRAIVAGFTPEEIARVIIYRTGIHELGHNLNLRHNFYGSVDKENFLPPSVPVSVAEYKKDENGNILFDKNNEPIQTGKKIPVLDENGKQKLWPSISSSVMDYVRLQDEFFSTQEWEPYDIAALRYAYSGGQLDDKKLYLFCTDEHTWTNALCNRHDKGTTPSEVAKALIEAYEDGYLTRNYRFGRAYWDTTGYMTAILGMMKEMKEFLPMWRTAFYESALRDELKKKGYSKDEAEQVVVEMSREIKQAIRLTIAFYQAVLQTRDTDKPFRSVFNEVGYSLERLGIGADKMVAMFFLAGDDEIYYNPNRIMLDASFLTYSYVPEFAPMMYKISENIVTQRVDMEPWFIGWGRQMYAQAAMNFSNRDDQSLISKMKIKKYALHEIVNYFNVDMEKETQNTSSVFAKLVTLDKSLDPDFRVGDQVAMVSYKSNTYMFSKQESPFAYDIFKNIKQAEENQWSTTQGQMDLEELYLIYSMTTGGVF